MDYIYFKVTHRNWCCTVNPESRERACTFCESVGASLHNFANVSNHRRRRPFGGDTHRHNTSLYVITAQPYTPDLLTIVGTRPANTHQRKQHDPNAESLRLKFSTPTYARGRRRVNRVLVAAGAAAAALCVREVSADELIVC